MTTRSAQLPGHRLAIYFDTFFTTIVGISTLGASISFSKVVSTPVKPWVDYGASEASIQNNLSMAFLLFVIDLAITSAAASALSLYRSQAIDYFGTSDSHRRRVVMWWATIVSVLIVSLVFAAFIFLGLVVAAYTGPIGWVTVGFISIFGLFVLGVIVWKSPIGSPSLEDILRRHETLHDFSSPEKAYEQPTLREFASDEHFYGEETVLQDRYRDGSPVRLNSTPMPFIDPVVPRYTADLRKLRSVRTSGDSRYVTRSQHLYEERKEASNFRTYT